MSIANAIAMIAVGGTRQTDGRLLIDTELDPFLKTRANFGLQSGVSEIWN